MTDLGSPPSLQLVADLHISLTSERGDASAYLRSDGNELVLGVDNPAVLLHEARRQKLKLPDVRALGLNHIPVRVRSRDRNLGRVWMTPGDKIHVRPTPAGLASALSIVLADARGRAAALGGSAVVAVTVAGLIRRRRHR